MHSVQMLDFEFRFYMLPLLHASVTISRLVRPPVLFVIGSSTSNYGALNSEPTPMFPVTAEESELSSLRSELHSIQRLQDDVLPRQALLLSGWTVRSSQLPVVLTVRQIVTLVVHHRHCGEKEMKDLSSSVLNGGG